MRPEEHPLWTEYRPVSNKEAFIGIFLGVVLFLSFFLWAMSNG